MTFFAQKVLSPHHRGTFAEAYVHSFAGCEPQLKNNFSLSGLLNPAERLLETRGLPLLVS